MALFSEFFPQLCCRFHCLIPQHYLSLLLLQVDWNLHTFSSIRRPVCWHELVDKEEIRKYQCQLSFHTIYPVRTRSWQALFQSHQVLRCFCGNLSSAQYRLAAKIYTNVAYWMIMRAWLRRWAIILNTHFGLWSFNHTKLVLCTISLFKKNFRNHLRIFTS